MGHWMKGVDSTQGRLIGEGVPDHLGRIRVLVYWKFIMFLTINNKSLNQWVDSFTHGAAVWSPWSRNGIWWFPSLKSHIFSHVLKNASANFNSLYLLLVCRCYPVGMANIIDISWFQNVSPSKESMYRPSIHIFSSYKDMIAEAGKMLQDL